MEALPQRSQAAVPETKKGALGSQRARDDAQFSAPGEKALKDIVQDDHRPAADDPPVTDDGWGEEHTSRDSLDLGRRQCSHFQVPRFVFQGCLH